MCRTFSLFLLVYEIIHPKVGQWEIFVVPSGDNTSRKKCFESRKSPTHFDALISEEHFGQNSLKYGKSTHPMNGPFAASSYMVQHPPYWRASYALGHPQQRKCKFVLMKSLCSGCPSG